MPAQHDVLSRHFLCVDDSLFLLLLLQEVADFGEEHFFLCWLWCRSGGSLFGFLLLAEGRCLGDGLHDEEEANVRCGADGLLLKLYDNSII